MRTIHYLLPIRLHSKALIFLPFLLSFLFLIFSSSAVNAQEAKASKSKKQGQSLQVDVFVSSDCAHCQKLETFLRAKQPENPWLKVQFHVINQDKAALNTFGALLKQHHYDDFAVPSIFFCNIRWMGFVDSETSGKNLLANLNYCRKQIQKEGAVSSQTEQMLRQMSYANWNQENFDNAMPDWILIPTMAFLDVISPETAFIILTLVCFVRIETDSSLKKVSFGLFLLGVGLAHYFQQAYTVYYYEIINLMRFPAVLIGIGLLTYLFTFHPKFFAKKPRVPVLITLFWLLLTGLAVQMYQQLHLSNFSLSFSQWMMTQQDLGTHTQWVYALYFQLSYLAIVGIISGLLIAMLVYYGKLAQHKMLVDEFSWHYLMLIGFILCIYPFLFAGAWAAFITFIVALVSSWLSYKYWSKKHPGEHLT